MHYEVEREEDMPYNDLIFRKGVTGSQVGGNHYESTIQPIDYIFANNLGFCEGNAIKYLTRWQKKGGVEDLRKAKHYIEMLIEQET